MSRSVIMMDMTKAGSMNGVTRCIRILANGLSQYKSFNVTWVRFVYGELETKFQPISVQLNEIRITLPSNIEQILSNKHLRYKYWETAYRKLCFLFRENPILHLHTLNLIEFALLVKERIPCKIVTHLHCLPWKGLYNSDITTFNALYAQYYFEKELRTPELFIRHDYERLAYVKSDALVSVTECARKFIFRVCPNHTSNIRVIVNGIQDMAKPKKYTKSKGSIKCLFVGNAHSSKGLAYVLAAMQACLIRLPSELTIVGALPKPLCDEIINLYPFLELKFMGQVPFNHLRLLYAQSDIGIISSLQEQCSYVAIEMMMAGLPVITTDVDGLDELFKQGYNGIKIPVNFSPRSGLQPDIIKMADAIVELGENPTFRKRIGENGRKRYLTSYSREQMISNIKDLYTSL